MEGDRTQRYRKNISEINDLLNQKELGAELEEVFKYYLEVLSGEDFDKKHYVSIMAEDLISKVEDFPNKRRGR